MKQAQETLSERLRAGDEVAEDTWLERLVVVPPKQPEGLRPSQCVVWDLIEDAAPYVVDTNRLSRSLTEMQVIAFMAASGVCVCCGRDGGRVRPAQEVTKDPALCGECWRGCCDQRRYPCREEGIEAHQQMVKRFVDESNLEEGQYRRDAETQRYVELLWSFFPDNEVPWEEDQRWYVEDVLTGQRYWRKEENLWDELPITEMEVIAWAAQEHPDIEISGD